MNALTESLSARRAEGLLIPYLLVDAGREARVRALARSAGRSGAAALELGFPFSDPIADGPLLQAAAHRSLARGTRWAHLLRALRAASPELPCAVMTYANPVYSRGLQPAMGELSSAGASALIVPDLGWEEAGPWRAAANRGGLRLITMAAPADSAARLRRLLGSAQGFLYLVSRYGTTGSQGARNVPLPTAAIRLAHRIRPDLPVLLGFGIRSAGDVARARAAGADGVVVGSEFEREIGPGGSVPRAERVLTRLAKALKDRSARPPAPEPLRP